MTKRLGRLAAGLPLAQVAWAGEECPTSHPYAFRGSVASADAGSRCCATPLTGAADLGCGDADEQGWISYESKCCSAPFDGSDAADIGCAITPCTHNVAKMAEADLVIAADDGAPTGKLARVLKEENELCTGATDAWADEYTCQGSMVLMGLGTYGCTSASFASTDNALNAAIQCTALRYDGGIDVNNGELMGEWLSFRTAVPDVLSPIRTITVDLSSSGTGSVFAEGGAADAGVCRQQDATMAALVPTAGADVTTRTYSCSVWGKRCITCQNGVKFAATAGAVQCSVCNACAGTGQEIKTACTSSSDAVCRCQAGFFGDGTTCTACAQGSFAAAQAELPTACTTWKECTGVGRQEEQVPDATQDRTCKCSEGYEGGPMAATDQCVAIPCPWHSSGDGHTAQCTCNNGYETRAGCQRPLEVQPDAAKCERTRRTTGNSVPTGLCSFARDGRLRCLRSAIPRG
jgi:hypothetical protein